jgi:hypothetical protein
MECDEVHTPVMHGRVLEINMFKYSGYYMYQVP